MTSDQASSAAQAGSGRDSGGTRTRREWRGRALVLGLDAEYASVVCEVLSTEFETRMTNGLEVALGLLASREYEAIVIDSSVATHVTLPTLIAHVRAGQPHASVLVTSQAPFRSRDIVECLNADADDYLPAPFHPAELLARVTRGVRRAQQARIVQRPRVVPAPQRRTAAYQPEPSARPLVAAARAS